MHNVACLCNLGDAGKQGNGGVFGNCLFGQALEDGDLHIPKKNHHYQVFSLCNVYY